MTKDEYVAKAKQQVARASARLPDHAGDCASCRWSSLPGAVRGRTCTHPAVFCVAFNTPDAYARDRIQECDEQRDSRSLWGEVICGPDGALFEERIAWWARLLGQKYPEER